jgi:hypothetical protein
MVLRIDYFLPIGIKNTVENRIETVRGLFPSWVNILTVRWQVNDEDVATADPQYEYRAMTLTLHPPFLDDQDWHSSLIHEIAHGIFRPYVQLVDKIIEKCAPDTSKEFLLDLIASKEEEVCEDLAIFIKKIQNNANV